MPPEQYGIAEFSRFVELFPMHRSCTLSQYILVAFLRITFNLALQQALSQNAGKAGKWCFAVSSLSTHMASADYLPGQPLCPGFAEKLILSIEEGQRTALVLRVIPLRTALVFRVMPLV